MHEEDVLWLIDIQNLSEDYHLQQLDSNHLPLIKLCTKKYAVRSKTEWDVFQGTFTSVVSEQKSKLNVFPDFYFFSLNFVWQV